MVSISVFIYLVLINKYFDHALVPIVTRMQVLYTLFCRCNITLSSHLAHSLLLHSGLLCEMLYDKRIRRPRDKAKSTYKAL